MPEFSRQSKERLSACDHRLQILFQRVVREFDCTVLEGHRDKERQNLLFGEGKSKARYPNSKHNTMPSMAVDVAPYPINWNDRERFYWFAGFVQATARELCIPIRWGGDWNQNWSKADNAFDDLVHFELAV